MTRTIFTAAALALALSTAAEAEQFAVQIDDSYNGASVRLMETLKVSEIESFSENGAHYVVLEAPNEAYVEAFFLAIGRNAIALNVLEADWSKPAMSELSIGQRLGFLQQVDCGFCTS